MTTDKGIVALDFDGTMVDSMPGLRRLACWTIGDETGRTEGIVARYNMTAGMPFRQQLNSILPSKEGYTPALRDRIDEKYEKEKVSVTLDAEPFDDVLKSLPGFLYCGYRLAVVSSTRSRLIIDRLHDLGIWHYFDACMGVEASSMKRTKLRDIRAKYFIGDSESDFVEADAADCYFFGVRRDPDLMTFDTGFSDSFAPVMARFLEMSNAE